ncbi:dihydrofolate reductase family protein [Jiangella endophytica]|uniref:dihydrofolate reductase family protein n=1 Tax=Jiangella endophytica TaxID=1623398 RepID=UPI000E3441E5|nr:dihydrofolate reductase family protein [Jiangella endophytica]
MRLTITTQVTVDGVMQGNGPSEPDRQAGFERDGWAMAHFDDESAAYVDQVYQRADAFLFGRWTYEFFAATWGTIDEMAHAAIGRALGARPKYVASSTLTDPGWADTTVLSGDVAAAVRELKARPGGELQVHGSGVLTRWLLENGLVDELNLLVVPVVVGQGTRLFPDAGPDVALDLVEARAFPKGIILQVYRPAGRPRYATG